MGSPNSNFVLSKIKDASDHNSVSVSGSSGSTSISIGSKAGRYDLLISVTYTNGSKSLAVHEVEELCIVDVFSVSGGGETICKDLSVDFHAEPAPTTCEFPEDHPEWEMGKKDVNGQFGNWESKGTGADISVTFDKVGVFILRARCGATSKWVESLEVKVPSDGTITTDPNIVCAEFTGNITLKATLDDTSAFHDELDYFPIWEKSSFKNTNDWVSLPQLSGKLSYNLPFSNDGTTGEIKVRAKFCDSYEWKYTTIKIVDIASVSLDKSLVCVDETVNVKAIPTSGDLLQESEVRWWMIYKAKYADEFDDGDWRSTSHDGKQSFSHTFNKSGVYKFRVKCCVTDNWIESSQICVFENKILNSVRSATLIEEIIIPPLGNDNNYGRTYAEADDVKVELKVYLNCETKNWKITVSKITSDYRIFYRIFSNQIEASAANATAQNCHRMIQNLEALGVGPVESIKFYSTEAVEEHERGHVEDWKEELNEELSLFIENLSQLAIPANCGDTEENITKKFYKDFDLNSEITNMAKRAVNDWQRLGHSGNSVIWEKTVVDRIIFEIKALGYPDCN